ncbi:transglutaminase-like cysteine peptidase [Croceicoccus sp. BE223]|uniref:transglutaminase-like cysteine peptidase n=1 Tax=Croceicoccus sp. BE223 TaxID=2817716 RepID=UPI002858C549|nr:transglutaminase-like cysteine peptidase [Croceicoccus sp. BE223]MDR7103032.1 putative transglutaminase-like cysteine proteinase [Croceicoccus sp. BE223]
MAVFAAPGQAQAGVAGSALIASAVANVGIAAGCRLASADSFTSAQPVGGAALVSRPKGRPMSALERMRQQQDSGLGFASASLADTGAASSMPAIAVRAAMVETPVMAPAAILGVTCAERFDPVRPGTLATSPIRPPRDFLDSRILPVSSTLFDKDWQRVSHAGNAAARTALLQADDGQGALTDRIGKVNRWINRAVAYTADSAHYGKADYWASAGETLASGKGDCEDYAIAKMEVLAAMGVSRRDMYLTIARDLVRQDDHAVLIVKVDGRAILLDNASDELLDGDTANDFRPILSFSDDRRYLHGY